MTRRLILVRHAKSSWEDPGQDDHARPLNARGRASAQAVGEWLAARGYLPDHVLCSNATRTAETLALLIEAWPVRPKVQYRQALYHASASGMLDILRRAEGQVVAMVGHNPGIAGFACGMVNRRPDHPRFSDYPTCATAVIDFPIDRWSDAAPASGTVIDFTVPRDLIGGDAD